MTDNVARDKAWAEWRDSRAGPHQTADMSSFNAGWDTATQVNSAELAEARAALAERDATIAAVRALADEWDAACRHDRANQAVACFDCLARSRRLRRILPAVDAGEAGE